MVKKIYKKDGIIVVNNKNQPNIQTIELYNYILHHYKTGHTIQDYLKMFYISKGFIYS
jgi:hypothetical protein